VLPHTWVSVSCDLTKKFEATVRGTVSEALEKLRTNPNVEEGEYCVVFQWNDEVAPKAPPPALSLEAQLFEGVLQAQTLRQSVDALVEAGERKNAVKAAALRVKALLKEAPEA